MDFDAFDLAPRLRQNIRDLGYETPTPIQHKAIPPVLEGRDVIGLAQTGTGKTAAFAIPIIQRLMRGLRHHLRVLVIGPTRELAEQTVGAFHELGAHMHVRCAAVYGGVGMQPQVTALRGGAEVVVACPGRLLDHMRQGTIKLGQVECLVLDEADRMFDMGFLPDIRKIIRELPKERQTLLFSATMPDEIRALATDFLHAPVTVQIAHSRPVDTVSHALYPVRTHLKTQLLVAILASIDRESVLVFTRTKHRAKRLAEQLSRAGHAAACIQGNLSQSQRTRAMDGFRSGKYRILVATDIVARGIDVSTISHVINYDMPHTVDEYTHRIGRTGRAAKTGDAFTLVSADDETLVRAIERLLGARIERRTLPDFDYAAAAPPHALHGRGPAPRRQGREYAAAHAQEHGHAPARQDSRRAAHEHAEESVKRPAAASPHVTHRAPHHHLTRIGRPGGRFQRRGRPRRGQR